MKIFAIPLFFLILILSGCSKGPADRIFREEIIDPMPASVSILDGSDTGGLSVNLYLHFRIHEPDITSIITSQSYIQDAAVSPASMFLNDNNRPPWWLPESLGVDRTQFFKEIIPSGGGASEGRRYLIVSKSRKEAFFLSYYYY